MAGDTENKVHSPRQEAGCEVPLGVPVVSLPGSRTTQTSWLTQWGWDDWATWHFQALLTGGECSPVPHRSDSKTSCTWTCRKVSWQHDWVERAWTLTSDRCGLESYLLHLSLDLGQLTWALWVSFPSFVSFVNWSLLWRLEMNGQCLALLMYSINVTINC